MSELLLTMENIKKIFPGIVALDKVSMDLLKGEVHVIYGENGAGKSTLMKVLSGIYQPDLGALYLKGQKKTNHYRRRWDELEVMVRPT